MTKTFESLMEVFKISGRLDDAVEVIKHLNEMSSSTGKILKMEEFYVLVKKFGMQMLWDIIETPEHKIYTNWLESKGLVGSFQSKGNESITTIDIVGETYEKVEGETQKDGEYYSIVSHYKTKMLKVFKRDNHFNRLKIENFVLTINANDLFLLDERTDLYKEIEEVKRFQGSSF